MTNDKNDGGTSLTEDVSVSVSASDVAIARHTPAPWKVYDQGRDDGPEYGCFIQSASDRDDWIASDITNRANAQLIAAAPEMLFELKGILAFTDGFRDYFSDEPIGHELRKWIEGARRVVAKAEGKS